MNAYPAERWPGFIDETIKSMEDTPGAGHALAQLQELDLSEQRKGFSFMASQYVQFVDKFVDRGHWQKVDGLYEVILTEFPDILNNKDDVIGAVALGKIIESKKGGLTAAWKKASGTQKLEAAKTLLSQAYPEDDTTHLHVAPVDVKKVIAGFSTSLHIDTMVCGPFFMNGESFGFPLYLFAHEFQHRRQLKLADRLEKNQLVKGSAEYYQARLIRANFDGGYLTPSTAANKVAWYARLTDYFEQPVERQANDSAKLSGRIGQTGGDVVWSLSEGFSRIISAAARPVDTVVGKVEQVVSAIGSIGHRTPTEP